jgi:hypothetical protein
METAKVDLRKLQLLNDRITQVIDALNQVRFSVHGLQHTAGYWPGYNTAGLGWGVSPWNNTTQFGTPFVNAPGAGINGISPGGFPPSMTMTGQVPGIGLSHTAAETGLDPLLAQQMAARLAQPWPVPGAFPYAQAVQFAQTFPWAYVPVSPTL